jgi:hypothetical protein
MVALSKCKTSPSFTIVPPFKRFGYFVFISSLISSIKIGIRRGIQRYQCNDCKKIYINSTLIETVTYNGYPIQDKFGFGGFINIPKDFYNGLIDDVRIYNKALTQTEINELYKLGN